jgi:hypothetical protein
MYTSYTPYIYLTYHSLISVSINSNYNYDSNHDLK